MVEATADFSGTITLGTVLIAVLVAVLFFLSTMKDRQTGRWRDLYQLADEERKELQAELNEARALITELREQVAKLEALQMPLQVVRSLHENATAAAERQVQILAHLTKHEAEAAKRGTATLNLLRLIADRLGPEPNGHEKENIP
jgi:glutamyl-tRNA reductase